MPRECGASSIPETEVLEQMVRGVLDRPVKPATTVECVPKTNQRGEVIAALKHRRVDAA
jgi:hypothetical protein